MGKYENQLRAITDGADWEIGYLNGLKSLVAELETDMAKIARTPGWTGVSADAASASFSSLRDRYDELGTKLRDAESALRAANEAKARARTKRASLPDAGVPDWIHTAALVGGGILIPVPGIGTFAAEMVVQKVNEFMGAQREAHAYDALQQLESDLVPPKRVLAQSRPPVGDLPEWPQPGPTPDWPGEGVTWQGDHSGGGAWSTGGAGGGSVGTGKPFAPLPPHIVTLPPVCPGDWPIPTVASDGDLSTGTIGGGGLGGGLLGAGAGIGGLAAASKLAKGGLGAGGMFGGAGAGGAGGVSVAGGMGGGAGSAGGRSSAAMMGGGAPGGGGGSEKEKRHGLGLIAPKLEDDEETGPRSAAAGAGGRE